MQWSRTAPEEELTRFRELWPMLPWENLTDAEIRVCKFYLAGYSARAIAQRFGRSYKTIEGQLRRSRVKLGLPPRRGIELRAALLGLVFTGVAQEGWK